jgi:hypothetical protein
MKYIILFEAFGSELLSKVSSFIKNKVSINHYNNFIGDLKKIANRYDLPVSNIKEDEIEYLNKKKAIKVNPEGDEDITAIKFWFSINNGYLGHTGTGNPINSDNSDNSDNILSKNEIDFLKKERGLETGELSPVINYKDLENGSLVVGYFSSKKELEKLAEATIYIEGNNLYAIQNVSNGGEPASDSWKKFGRFSWSLGMLGNVAYDHKKLNHYKKSEKELGYYEEINQDNYLYFNLPIDLNYGMIKLTHWVDSDTEEDIIEKADFAVILHIKKILKRGYKKHSYIKKEREKMKSGSPKFMSDDDFKKINIDRYLTSILLKMGFKSDKTLDDVKDLQKILLSALNDNNALYSLYDNSHEILDPMINKIKELFNSSYDEDSFKRYLNSLKESYIDLYNKKEINKVRLRKNKELISKSYFKEISLVIDDINNKIYDHIKSKKINSIADLKMNMYKLNSIASLLWDEDTKLKKFNSILNRIFDPESIFKKEFESILNFYGVVNLDYPSGYKNIDYFLEEDLKRIKKIKEYVNSILN